MTTEFAQILDNAVEKGFTLSAPPPEPKKLARHVRISLDHLRKELDKLNTKIDAMTAERDGIVAAIKALE